MKKRFLFKKEKTLPRQIRASRSYHLVGKRKLIKKFYFWFIFFIILGLFYFCFYSDFFIIKKTEIFREKNIEQKISNQQIENYILSIFLENRFLIFSQGNLLIFDEKSAENKIKDNFPLEIVIISKRFPNKLKIIIGEKIPIANLALLEQKYDQKEENQAISTATTTATSTERYIYYLIDKKGDILEKTEEINTQFPLIYDLKENAQYPYLSEGKVSFILDLFEKFPQRIQGLNISSFEIGDSKESGLTVVTSENWKIYFDFNEDIIQQLDKLFLVLDQKIKDQRKNLQYIDLRFEDRIYYKGF